jgi:hypothetical protein
MKKLIKKLLRESLANVDEIYFMRHSNDRIKERINVFTDKDIPNNVKSKILSNIDLLDSVNLNPNKDYGVMLGSFKPNKESEHYIDVNGRGYYRIMDDTVIHDSTGDQFWVVVRENKATTVMLRKAIQTRDVNHNKEKLRVDVIIKDLPNYLNKLKQSTNQPSREKFKKYKLPSGEAVRYYPESNRFETLEGQPIEMDNIFDALPEDMQDMVLSKMD